MTEKRIFDDDDFSDSYDSEGLEDSTHGLLHATNTLLASVGITAKQIMSYDELFRVSSSMFVAIFETIFKCRIEGINRDPQSPEDYERYASI